MWEPENGGKRPSSVGVSANLFKVPWLGRVLAKFLGGGIGGPDVEKSKNADVADTTDTGGTSCRKENDNG